MPKLVTGELKCTIIFKELWVEDGQDLMDALFPEG